MPAVLFATTLALWNISAAIVAGLAWMVAVTCVRQAWGYPLSGLLLLTLGVMIVRSTLALATGSTFVYFIQPVVSDGCIALIFLASLLTRRPVVVRLAGDFYPLTAELAARPRVKRLLRQLTLMWGLVVVLKGLLTLWLLATLSTVSFVLVKGPAVFTLTMLATAATITIAASVVSQERQAADVPGSPASLPPLGQVRAPCAEVWTVVPVARVEPGLVG